MMLKAVGIDREAWPEFGGATVKRNEASLKFDELKTEINDGDESAPLRTTRDFKLIKAVKTIQQKRDAALPCYAEFYCMFPPSHIQNAVFKNRDKMVSFEKTMLIFRKNSDSSSETVFVSSPTLFMTATLLQTPIRTLTLMLPQRTKSTLLPTFTPTSTK